METFPIHNNLSVHERKLLYQEEIHCQRRESNRLEAERTVGRGDCTSSYQASLHPRSMRASRALVISYGAQCDLCLLDFRDENFIRGRCVKEQLVQAFMKTRPDFVITDDPGDHVHLMCMFAGIEAVSVTTNAAPGSMGAAIVVAGVWFRESGFVRKAKRDASEKEEWLSWVDWDKCDGD